MSAGTSPSSSRARHLLAGDQQAAAGRGAQAARLVSKASGRSSSRLLHRGVGVHHAGLLPKYRRIVEDLFQRKLLPVAICTETLAAGHQPARAERRADLAGQGPAGRQEADRRQHAPTRSSAAPAGRSSTTEATSTPWPTKTTSRSCAGRRSTTQIPEDTKDPGLLKAKKALKKKRPTRRETETYWNEAQFEKLKSAPPGKLYSKGPLPWRLLAYLLEDFARSGEDPESDPQAADGRAASQGGRSRAGSDAAFAVGWRLCETRAATAGERRETRNARRAGAY